MKTKNAPPDIKNYQTFDRAKKEWVWKNRGAEREYWNAWETTK